MTVRLDIDTHPGPSHDNNTYTVRIDVHLPTTRSDAEALINNGASIKLRVMGEDTWSDDTQIGPLTYTRGRIFAQNDGIHLRVSLAATHDQLNEDWGAIDTAGDEIYVKATWLDGTGTSLTKRSNKVTGRF